MNKGSDQHPTPPAVAGGCQSSAKEPAAKDKAELQQAPATPIPVAGGCQSSAKGNTAKNKAELQQAPATANAATPPPYPPETRELINEALSKCVERFRFPPEERPKIHRAAELGNPFGQYLWGLICHYDLGEPLEAWDWFSRSAEHGYHDSVRHQALLMESGLIPLKGSSRNPATHARQIRAAATQLYLKAAELGNYQAKFQYALCCLEGRGRAVNFREAAHWLLESACQGHKPAQERLAALCLDPAISAYDPFEACVWASVAATPETAGIFAALGSLLSPAGIDAAQAEAVRRSALIAENGRLSPEDLAAFERPLAAPRKRSAAPAREAPRVENFQAWQVQDFTQLAFDFYPGDKTVQISYERYKPRIKYSEFDLLFSRFARRLFEDHFKAVTSTEPKIDYNGETIAYTGPGRNRKNFKVVSDINSKLRKVFGHSDGSKPLYWTKERNPRDRSLLAVIKIRFHY